MSDGETKIHYEKLCIATGAHPKRSFPLNKNILSIRDTDSISILRSKLAEGMRRVLLIGNGGIATELM